MDRAKSLEELNKLFNKKKSDPIIFGWEPWRSFPWKASKGSYVAYGKTIQEAQNLVEQWTQKGK